MKITNEKKKKKKKKKERKKLEQKVTNVIEAQKQKQ